MNETPAPVPESPQERRLRRVEAHQRLQMYGMLVSLLLVLAILRDPAFRAMLDRADRTPLPPPIPVNQTPPAPLPSGALTLTPGEPVVELDDGRVTGSLEEAAAWLKRMAGKLGSARLRMHDIQVELRTEQQDWVLSVSTLDSDGPTRLAIAARLWLVLLFTADDMTGVVPEPDPETTGEGRLGMLFVIPRVPYSARGERY